jgi:hypothetical protein
VAAAEARGIKIVGAGENLAAARKPAIVEAGGTNVGFLAYCSVLPRGYDATPARAGVAPLRARTFYEQVDWQAGTPPRVVTMANAADLAALEDDVRRLREQADVVVVSMHWGIHFEPGTIADYQYEAAHAAIDAGADVILGHHGHVIKGVEFYRGKPVFYSLGNVTLLPRGDAGEPLTEGGQVDAQLTMIAKITVEGGTVSRVALIPCWLDLRLEPQVIPPGDSPLSSATCAGSTTCRARRATRGRPCTSHPCRKAGRCARWTSRPTAARSSSSTSPWPPAWPDPCPRLIHRHRSGGHLELTRFPDPCRNGRQPAALAGRAARRRGTRPGRLARD